MSSTSPVLTFAIRSTQALFAIVVFGLSTTLIRGHHLGSLPSTLGFVAFVGGLSFIGALLGIAAHWMQVLQAQIGVLMDAVIAGINLAGGIPMAIKLKGAKCQSVDYQKNYDSAENVWKMVTSDIICGGLKKTSKTTFDCYNFDSDGKRVGALLSRCNMSQADSVFMFLTAIVVGVAATLGCLRMKSGY